MTQGELFPDPTPKRTPRLATPPPAPRYARIKPAARWCDACIRAIHLHGLVYADPVRKATWMRVAAWQSTTYLCEIHKNEQLGNER